ncbi:unnamed protein product [Cuscuta epithymum]|uniref:Uncharacterized protein n=1 Tax=Cuscuta epithymum TaxID=186058 RepID=A0AAV0D2J8_9ASTE|nr:unnamed protein product [Cuscuta epithymum]
MSRSWGKLPRCSIGSISRQQSFITSAFSTSSGDGGGYGRGGGGFGSGSSSVFGFTPNQNESGDSKDDESASAGKHSGIGHGRGSSKPLFSFVHDSNGPAGRGRGIRGPASAPRPQSQEQMPPKLPLSNSPSFFVKEEDSPDFRAKASVESSDAASLLPSNIISVLSGAGRGKTIQTFPEKPKEENRHLREKQNPQTSWQRPVPGGPENSRPSGQRFNRDDTNSGTAHGGQARSGNGEWRGRGGTIPWRGRSGFSERGRGGRGSGEGKVQEDVGEKYGDIFNVGDAAAAEKLAQEIGPDIMSQLAEGIEEIAPRIFPSRIEDAYLDALDTNLKIECEEEYMMGEFDRNPDIDEKPPIPLRDALEKMKPFLMVYEGIESQEEWEEAMKETMEVRLPLIKEIVDHYSGPDRVTAKQQHEELKRVASTLPQSAPNSVKMFTDRAVQSLQSNPGWGFHKKCQFMDKLAYRVSQQYK